MYPAPMLEVAADLRRARAKFENPAFQTLTDSVSYTVYCLLVYHGHIMHSQCKPHLQPRYYAIGATKLK